jgi:hypothetical protein
MIVYFQGFLCPKAGQVKALVKMLGISSYLMLTIFECFGFPQASQNQKGY